MLCEIDVTCLTDEFDPRELSGSIAERGPNAGPETWQNSKDAAKESPLEMTDDERRAAKDYFRGFGAWEDEEIDAWSIEEIDALILQYAAGDLRELESLCPADDDDEDSPFGIDWEEAERLSREGTISGNLFVHHDPSRGGEPRLYVDLSK